MSSGLKKRKKEYKQQRNKKKITPKTWYKIALEKL